MQMNTPKKELLASIFDRKKRNLPDNINGNLKMAIFRSRMHDRQLLYHTIPVKNE